MIAGVNSLEEAFEYVRDKEVREELQYQYEYHVKPLLEKAAKVNEYEDRIDDLEDDLEDLTMTIEDYESENDDLNERVDELEALVEELKKQKA